jgi:hypothetical protein
VSEREEELQSLLDIYTMLKKDDSEFNLYKDSKTLDELIEKAQNELKELKDE